MSFWNNPENNPIKVIGLVIIIAVLGYFSYTYLHKNSLSGTGQVVDTASYAKMSQASTPGFIFTTEVTGKICTMKVCSATNPNQCIPLTGTPDAGGACALDKDQPTPEAQGLLKIIDPSLTPTPTTPVIKHPTDTQQNDTVQQHNGFLPPESSQ